MNDDAPSNHDALKALEQFVVDNDVLMQLEQRIGRFNIFDALGVARVEIRHSNFLAWLLDPAESHGQGSLFLRAILMDLLRQAPVKDRPFSPVQLDGRDMRGVEVRREWKNIDLLITCQDPDFVVAVENKIDSSEHDKQLERYEDTVNKEFPDSGKLLVFLTKDGRDPSRKPWVPYSYASVHGVLDRCRTTNKTSIGKDVAAFLDHYLRLIGSRFMDDPQIADLCQRIYRNHRQALDLIFENCVTGSSVFVRDVVDILEADENSWHIVRATSRVVDFVPVEWTTWLPSIGAPPLKNRQYWFYWRFEFANDGVSLRFYGEVGPIQDAGQREKIIKSLRDAKLVKEKKYTSMWTRVDSKVILRWNESDTPETEKIRSAVHKVLGQLAPRLDLAAETVRPFVI